MEIAGASGKDIAGFLLCRGFGGNFLISIYVKAASCHIKIAAGVNARANSRHKRAAADWATHTSIYRGNCRVKAGPGCDRHHN